jgi:hypothetical protein
MIHNIPTGILCMLQRSCKVIPKTAVLNGLWTSSSLAWISYRIEDGHLRLRQSLSLTNHQVLLWHILIAHTHFDCWEAIQIYCCWNMISKITVFLLLRVKNNFYQILTRAIFPPTYQLPCSLLFKNRLGFIFFNFSQVAEMLLILSQTAKQCT